MCYTTYGMGMRLPANQKLGVFETRSERPVWQDCLEYLWFFKAVPPPSMSRKRKIHGFRMFWRLSTSVNCHCIIIYLPLALAQNLEQFCPQKADKVQIKFQFGHLKFYIQTPPVVTADILWIAVVLDQKTVLGDSLLGTNEVQISQNPAIQGDHYVGMWP